MRRVSLNARLAADAAASAEIDLVLIHITHPDLDAPIRLSTDPTSRLSIEPLQYGTYSNWLTEDGSPFLFCLVSVLLPDDQEDAAQTAKLVIETIDNDIVTALRSTTTRSSVNLASVMASSPDVVEGEWLGFECVSVEIDPAEITLNLSQQPLMDEPFPAGRMTRQAFPGVNR